MSFVMRMLAALIWGLHDLVVRVASPRGAVAPLLLTALLAGTVLLASSRSCPGRAADEAGLALLPRTAFAAARLGLHRAFAIGPCTSSRRSAASARSCRSPSRRSKAGRSRLGSCSRFSPSSQGLPSPPRARRTRCGDSSPSYPPARASRAGTSLPENSRTSRKSWAWRMRPLKVSEPGKLGHVRDGELTRGQDHPIELLRNPAVHTEVVDDHGELARDLVMGTHRATPSM